MRQTVTRAWRVTARDAEKGRGLKVNREPSFTYDFSRGNNIRIIQCICADITGGVSSAVIIITRNTAEECEREFIGQCSDGIFENERRIDWKEIPMANE